MHGWLGVHVFFVISGYCIAARLSEDLKREAGPAAFIGDRLWRIFPPYWAALFLTATIGILGTAFNKLPVFGSPTSPGALPSSVVEAAAAFLALEPWFGMSGYLLVAWTLSYEIGFYLIAALIFQVTRSLTRRSVGIILAGLLALWAFVAPAWLTPGPIALWPHFALGIAVWVLLATKRRLIPLVSWSTLATGTLLFMVGELGRIDLGITAAVLTAYALTVLHAMDDSVTKIRSLGWLSWLGTISYSLYLTHVPVAGRFRNLMTRMCRQDDWTFMWVPAAGTVLAVGVAAIFYRTIEAPNESLRRKFRHKAQQRSL